MKKILILIFDLIILAALGGCYVGVAPDRYGDHGSATVGISLPPPLIFPGPPDVIVMPDTDDVYVVPDVDVDIFFWNGYWWRPWESRWYRSSYYDRGWGYYNTVPTFYVDVDPGWRGHYRDHDWYGHRWDYSRIPHRELQRNWSTWHNDRHWERQGTWGVKNYKPKSTSYG